MLTPAELQQYRDRGHLTVPGIFSDSEMEAALEDIQQWGDEFIASLSQEQQQWYLEKGVGNGQVIRKLDQPVFHRRVFRQIAESPKLLPIIKQILGPDLQIVFSQVFCKPPSGGPKPAHQDNFYFGPDDPEAMVTAWIALEEATLANGCLHYGSGSHRGGIIKHAAPEDQPFNLQIPAERLSDYPMVASPVPAGGISLHHGNTWHCSSANHSDLSRRATAIHYLRSGNRLQQPALRYPSELFIQLN